MTEQPEMTIATRRSHPSRDHRMEDVKRELSRALERELSFRAAERDERRRLLDLGAADERDPKSA